NHSEHPLARAVVQEAQSRQISFYDVEQFNSTTGGGVSGIIQQKSIIVGQLSFMEENLVTDLARLQDKAKIAQEQANSVIFVAYGREAIGFFAIADSIKASSMEAIKELHRLGIKVIMVTGDNPSTAQAIAKKLNIYEVYAGINPKDKIDLVRQFKNKYYIVAMTGDGINDSPALAEADVGIAMGTGTDVAIESAGVTLVKGDLMGVAKAISLSRATMHNIRQNLFFAFIYNLIGIPIAAGVLYPFNGLLLSPMIASAAMALSSLSVIFNALRLKKNELKAENARNGF
ncbi:MAG: HAD-IC family P-type ATPase, partial [Nitrosopumilus sp.]|nr:HAD-IC family P-type ATPase [Nitrosopumilus sp.]